jgi:hypothetical protein
MRVGIGGSVRALATDRNYVDVTVNYLALAVGPHGNTVRSTSTAPANTFLDVMDIFNFVRRETAAAPVGLVESRIYGTTTAQTYSYNRTLQNVIDNAQRDSKGSNIVIPAAGSIQIATADASTGGTNDYVITAKTAQFDA